MGDAAIGILTFVLVTITGYYALQTKKLVDRTQALVTETREGLKESLRAQVQLSFIRRKQLVIATLANTGGRRATAISVELNLIEDDSVKAATGYAHLTRFFCRRISSLAPGERLYHDGTTVLAIQSWAGQHDDPLEIEYSITFHDGYDTRTETHRLDLRDVLADQIVGFPGYLEMDGETRIADALELIASTHAPGPLLKTLNRIANAVGRTDDHV